MSDHSSIGFGNPTMEALRSLQSIIVEASSGMQSARPWVIRRR
jgi:hypothetical protein